MNDKQSELLAEGMRLLRSSISEELLPQLEAMSEAQYANTIRILTLDASLSNVNRMAPMIIFLAQLISYKTTLPNSAGVEEALADILTKSEEPDEQPETKP